MMLVLWFATSLYKTNFAEISEAGLIFSGGEFSSVTETVFLSVVLCCDNTFLPSQLSMVN